MCIILNFKFFYFFCYLKKMENCAKNWPKISTKIWQIWIFHEDEFFFENFNNIDFHLEMMYFILPFWIFWFGEELRSTERFSQSHFFIYLQKITKKTQFLTLVRKTWISIRILHQIKKFKMVELSTLLGDENKIKKFFLSLYYNLEKFAQPNNTDFDGIWSIPKKPKIWNSCPKKNFFF